MINGLKQTVAFLFAVNDENFPNIQSYGDLDQIINVDVRYNHMIKSKRLKMDLNPPYVKLSNVPEFL